MFERKLTSGWTEAHTVLIPLGEGLTLRFSVTLNTQLGSGRLTVVLIVYRFFFSLSQDYVKW